MPLDIQLGLLRRHVLLVGSPNLVLAFDVCGRKFAVLGCAHQMLGVDEGVAEEVRVRHHGDERGGREGVAFKVVDGGIVDLEGVRFTQCGWTVGGGGGGKQTFIAGARILARRVQSWEESDI